ncbi:pumilio homolog 3-like [Montipora capricornis]|uniref:pumilio homolog 3-like n=1 Tax=Montipora capricornis TaxID=246305 RepID=UPI0035F14B89
MADVNDKKSTSKSFKKKVRDKSDDVKLKVEPKKFSNETKANKLSERKRKASSEDNDKKTLIKAKKWKGDKQNEGRRTEFSQQEKENKKTKSGRKELQNKSEKETFGTRKTKKGYFNDGRKSKSLFKKRKLSEAGQHKKHKDSIGKPNIWQMKKKERKTFRRKQNETFDLIHSLKQIYETIRRKNCSKAEKIELIDKTLNLISGHSHEVIFKHDAGRVIQSCVKFGTEQQRQRLFEQFKDDFGELIKFTYSKFLVKKLLNYGTKEQREAIIKCFYGKVRKLIRHKEASSILETIYSDYANSAQKAFLIQEFYGADFAFFKSPELNSLDKVLVLEPARKTGILKYMKDALLPLIDKSVIRHSIIHRVLLEYLTHADDNSKLEMIELIKESIVLILHTHDGARVGMQCFWHGTVKDRKVLIKSFKTYYVKIAKEEFGHLVLLALFDSVDDTVLVKKIVFPEIQSSLKELAFDTYGRKVLLYLLFPRNPGHFTPTFVELLSKGDGNANSKKASETRQKELLEGISPALLQLVEENAQELVFDKGGCQIVLSTLLKCIGDVKPAMLAIAKLADRDLDPTSAEEDHIIKSAAGHYALKRLINQDKERLTSESKDQVMFSKILLDNTDPDTLFEWCKVNRGAFVVASLLESSVPGVSETVRCLLQSCVKKMKKFDSKGVEVVLKYLSS